MNIYPNINETHEEFLEAKLKFNKERNVMNTIYLNELSEEERANFELEQEIINDSLHNSRDIAEIIYGNEKFD